MEPTENPGTGNRDEMHQLGMPRSDRKNFLESLQSYVYYGSLLNTSMLSAIRFFSILLLLVLGSCSTPDPMITEQPVSIRPVESPTPEPIQAPAEIDYKGVNLTQQFPFQFDASFESPESRGVVRFQIDDYAVTAKDFVPLTLERSDSRVYTFPRRKIGGYWSVVGGISHLLGADSKQLYVEVAGPGAVCCTNYSIVDLSAGMPRTIFHSEDFGQFRNPMEIFDADGDGTYELVQFDSCLRYFRDDCGSCSPEPRVYFKYSNKLKRYLPAKGIVRDFVRDGFARSERWIDEKYSEWKLSKDLGLQVDLRRSLIAHVADLLHVGEDRKAWSLFTRYSEVVDTEDKGELQLRLSKCKAYKILTKTN